MIPTLALPPATPSTVHVALALPGTVAVNCRDAPTTSAAVWGAMLMTVFEAVTNTAVLRLLPPGPRQLNEKVVLAVSGEVTCDPPGGNVPLHPPDAVHAVALL